MRGNKKILLLAPPFMDLYKDIMSSLISLGYDVIWIRDCQIEGNPYNKKSINHTTKTVVSYNKEVDSFWNKQLDLLKDEGTFDYLIVIDGLMESPGFFEMLRHNYPNIKAILYLYDRVKGNYELDSFFKYYDKIYTFDKSDAKHFNIAHLPIYWAPCTYDSKEHYDIFGLASYKVERVMRCSVRFAKLL